MGHRLALARAAAFNPICTTRVAAVTLRYCPQLLLLVVLLDISASGICRAASAPREPDSAAIIPQDKGESIRTASLWDIFGRREKPVYDSLPSNVTPHPAVARIIV